MPDVIRFSVPPRLALPCQRKFPTNFRQIQQLIRLVHYVYLPINSQPSYDVVAKGSIILATLEAIATLFFFLIFLDMFPIG